MVEFLAYVARVAALTLALFTLVACGPPAPAKPPLRQLPLPASALLSHAPAIYGGPSVALPDDRGTAEAAALFAGFMGARATHEPAMDLVAAVVGKSFIEVQEMPAESLLQWLYWKCGATSTPGPVNILLGPEDTSEPFFQEHLRKLASLLPPGLPLTYGVARVAAPGHVVQAVAIGFRSIDIAPIPKNQAPGARALVRIKPKKPLAHLALYVDQGGPNVVELPMNAESDGSFSVEAPLPSVPGRYFAEIVGVLVPPDGALEKGWRQSLLWIPLYAGVPEPGEPDAFIRHPQRNHPDRSTWPAQVLNAYNDARARLGRPPLAFEAGASNLAQKRSEELALASHLPAPDMHVHDKLAAAGIPAKNVFGFVDQIEFVSEYLTLRLLRPAARFAIFHPEISTFALGLAPRQVAPDVGLTSSVEYLLQHIRIDPARDHARVQSELDTLDRAAGNKGLAENEALSRAAQSIVDEVCRGGPQPSDAKSIFARARGLDPSLHRRLAVPWLGYDLTREGITQLYDAAKGKAFTQVGVGVCQGTVEGHAGAVMMMALFAGP